VSQQAFSDSISQTCSTSKPISKPRGGISASITLLSLQLTQTSFSKIKFKYIFKTNFQNILTMEEGFYHENPFIAPSVTFYTCPFAAHKSQP
jgi:predicted NACHT family NTPase